MATNSSSYDSILYPGYTHPQTHPDRLEIIGRLFGLAPASARRCRVLELGCGNGANLIPMAWGLPESEFVGIDLAARPIAQGREMIRDLGLRNVRLEHGSITAINASWGKFDYILAHGFYSWVPPEIQERMLGICRHAMAPQGIAFVSYNALPGCHLRKMTREMMLFHIRDLTAPQERINQAQALVRFLADAQDTTDEFRLWMKAELKQIAGHDEGHLFHDELAELNEPLYFTQFMERAGRHDLQYLGEADYFEMSDHGFKDSVRQTLKQLARSRILREQYLDFLKCRRFRQTLLCQREVPLQSEPDASHVAGFLVSSTAGCTSSSTDLRAGVTCEFETPKGGKLETDYALGKAALAVLGETWPVPIAFDELMARSVARLENETSFDQHDPQHRAQLAGFLLQLYSGGLVDFRIAIPTVARTVSERPEASPIARWQAERGHVVTSLFHLAVKVEDEIGKNLLAWLDGTCDRKILLEKLWKLLEEKNALIVKDENPEAARRSLAAELDKNLLKLARFGLLVK
ncbi:MAG: methyltransferase domain-containing protein [Pedosphaera sp.]|nr:methyltransferase domain-containing protein [Pedosphaera sp.]